MRSEPVTFHSDGLALSGAWFWPDEAPPEPSPLVVACSGFTGLMRIHPERFARFLTARGRPCFGFDYRGFAGSDGPRGRVVLEEQVVDIVSAVTAAQGHDVVDASRIVLLGWGMGAGLVLEAVRNLPGVVGLVCVNGFYDGARVQRAHRGEEGFRDFVARAEEERRARVEGGVATETDPFDLYPLDPASRRYVDEVLRKTEGYDARPYSWELADSLLRFDAEAGAGKLTLPLLVAHGEENALHPPSEAEALLETYAGPKTLYWIPGAGHTEFMHDDDPTFQALAGRIDAWLGKLLER